MTLRRFKITELYHSQGPAAGIKLNPIQKTALKHANFSQTGSCLCFCSDRAITSEAANPIVDKP